VTQQYLAGELSVLLGRLELAASDPACALAVHRLRREAETVPPAALGPVAARALSVADEACWRALERGDALAFARQAEACGELWRFGVCADLLQEGPGLG